ncbi:MAG TPA: rhamnogalacturonan lyase [Paludibacter sp.]|nr:rhamnogalacturonan lyase [Paludibacter sp.]
MRKRALYILYFVVFLFLTTTIHAISRQMEYLNRGLVAVKVSSGVFLSWRYLGTDNPSIGFNIYRNNTKLNASPISNSTNYSDASGTISSIYKVLPILNGIEDTLDVKTVTPWSAQNKTIQLVRPAGGITEPNKYGSTGKAASGIYPNGQSYTYSPNDCSVGDVDGDGEYEIIVKWDPSNSQDNSYYGITGKVYIDAYKLDGTQLWRIDLGKNIRAGAHYTQFLVYDFDGDGLAEVICKTAPGTIDGKGNHVIINNDNPTADYRSLDTTQITGSRMLGTVLNGPEYLTLFDGKTGAELNTIAYNPPRGSLSSWGDSYGNRSDRFLACVAYLDGEHPSAVMCRGYYARTTLCSFDVKDKKLVQRWLFDSSTSSGISVTGQGNHNLSVADVDNDGKDEIIYGSCAFDNDGTVMYRTGLGHGDAMHVSDLDPDNPGLEVWEVHEDVSAAYGYELHDAASGKILWGTNTASDNGRGMAGDIDSRYPGFEMWSSSGSGTYTCKGVKISSSKPSTNFRIYWDGDLQDELLDGVKITKWTGNGTSTLLTGSGVSSCNNTKATPNLCADIIGDWREELILYNTSDPGKIVLYTTTTTTTNRLFTLMHDPDYRLGIAWQNAAYNQPPHLGFYIGGGLANVIQPDIKMVKYNANPTKVVSPIANRAVIYAAGGNLIVNSSEIIHSVSVYTLLGRLMYQDDNVNRQELQYNLPEQERLYIVKIKTNSGVQSAKVIN